MKIKIILSIISILSIIKSYSQSNLSDVIYLKNGSVIRGLIVEQVPNQSLKIKTFDKSIYVYKYDEIEKITKEESDILTPIQISKSTKSNKTDTSDSKKSNRSLYFNCSVGYAGNAARQTIGYINNETMVSGSLGTGILTNFRLGYHLNKNIALDLGLSYLYGSKILITSRNFYYNMESGGNWDDIIFKATIFNINPAISLFHSKEKCSFYARSGIVIGIMPNIDMSYSSNYTQQSISLSFIPKYSKFNGGVPIGFSNALGFNFRITNSISFISEFNLITQSWAPKFADKLKLSDSLKSSSDLNYLIPLSSVSLNLGFKVNL